MKKVLCVFILSLALFKADGQVTTLAPGNYKNITIQPYSAIANYTRILILLHEAYAATPLNPNYAIGTIIGLRGSTTGFNRVNIAEINSAAAYKTTTANVSSIYNSIGAWKLKTCLFNGKKYLALDVPYDDAYHNLGYKFTGWTVSTGENMLAVPYEVNGLPVNQSVIGDIQDFVANQSEIHDVQTFTVGGNVGIGTTDTKGYKLAVAGNMIAESVKVKLAGTWPDYVFSKAYELPSLQETEKHIEETGHLPGIPSATEVKTNGVDLGEMNAKLLQKLEEITLHLIKQEKEITQLKNQTKKLEEENNRLRNNSKPIK